MAHIALGPPPPQATIFDSNCSDWLLGKLGSRHLFDMSDLDIFLGGLKKSNLAALGQVQCSHCHNCGMVTSERNYSLCNAMARNWI